MVLHLEQGHLGLGHARSLEGHFKFVRASKRAQCVQERILHLLIHQIGWHGAWVDLVFTYTGSLTFEQITGLLSSELAHDA